MRAVIYGRPGCPYCVRAKQIADLLRQRRSDFEYQYVDMFQQNISKEDLEKTIGRPVHTVPQILLDDAYIGGCTDFEAYSRQHLGL